MGKAGSKPGSGGCSSTADAHLPEFVDLKQKEEYKNDEQVRALSKYNGVNMY